MLKTVVGRLVLALAAVVVGIICWNQSGEIDRAAEAYERLATLRYDRDDSLGVAPSAGEGLPWPLTEIDALSSLTIEAGTRRREQASVHFVLDLGRALHQLGHPSHWLEEGLGHVTPIGDPRGLFAALKAQGYLLGICTNDSEAGARAQCDRLGGRAMTGPAHNAAVDTILTRYEGRAYTRP